MIILTKYEGQKPMPGQSAEVYRQNHASYHKWLDEHIDQLNNLITSYSSIADGVNQAMEKIKNIQEVQPVEINGEKYLSEKEVKALLEDHCKVIKESINSKKGKKEADKELKDFKDEVSENYVTSKSLTTTLKSTYQEFEDKLSHFRRVTGENLSNEVKAMKEKVLSFKDEISTDVKDSVKKETLDTVSLEMNKELKKAVGDAEKSILKKTIAKLSTLMGNE